MTQSIIKPNLTIPPLENGDKLTRFDALLRIEKGGQSIISEDDYVEGAPELIVEIAASKVSIDLNDKMKAYRRNQVQEYLVWRVYDNEFDWFRLREGKYIKLEPDENGVIKSEIYSGLWLDINALLIGNLARVLEVLQQGLATKEHQEFVNLLSNS
ncbi:Uma2 family endonuclease [Aphanothece sacrum]|nr:Uma2 family endonuclease [Aphanothece sacrum]